MPSPPTDDDTDLLAHLRALEIELHHPGVRCTPARLEALLHPGFHEVGRSGRAWDRASVLGHLAARGEPPRVDSDEFQASRIADGVALLTYRSVQHAGEGVAPLVSRRMSLWVLGPAGWQLRYHQGTPADEAS